MPFIIKTGNILDDDADMLVNTVNTVGIMGKGLALAFKQRHPAMFEQYRIACQHGMVRVGYMHYWMNPANGQVIVNFPTKQHWRDPSRLHWIVSGLADLKIQLQLTHDIGSIAIPPLGCGLGGLNWDDVLPSIKHTFAELSDAGLEVRIYPPQ